MLTWIELSKCKKCYSHYDLDLLNKLASVCSRTMWLTQYLSWFVKGFNKIHLIHRIVLNISIAINLNHRMNLKLGFKWRCVIHSWCLGRRSRVWYWGQVAGVFMKIKLCLSPNRWSWASHSYTSRYVRVLRLFRNEKSWELNISYRLNMNLIVGRIVVDQCVYNPLDSSPWRTLLYVHDSNVEHEWIFISISIKIYMRMIIIT